jgi:hypothetical protein
MATETPISRSRFELKRAADDVSVQFNPLYRCGQANAGNRERESSTHWRRGRRRRRWRGRRRRRWRWRRRTRWRRCRVTPDIEHAYSNQVKMRDTNCANAGLTRDTGCGATRRIDRRRCAVAGVALWRSLWGGDITWRRRRHRWRRRRQRRRWDRDGDRGLDVRDRRDGAEGLQQADVENGVWAESKHQHERFGQRRGVYIHRRRRRRQWRQWRRRMGV